MEGGVGGGGGGGGGGAEVRIGMVLTTGDGGTSWGRNVLVPFKCALLSLWCLGRKVLGNCIDS